MTAPATQEKPRASFIEDWLRAGYTIETQGIYYSAHSLLVDARHLDELGTSPALRWHRDSAGRIDGIELARLVPNEAKPALKIEAAKCARCKVNPIALNGFCAECLAEIEQDIDFDDIAPSHARRQDDFGCDICSDPNCYRNEGVVLPDAHGSPE